MLQILIIAGSVIFASLGCLHAVMTVRDLRTPRAFTPPDPGLREARQSSSLRLHPAINFWDAWMGFNLSHSLGLVVFGGLFLHVGLFEPLLFRDSGLIQATGFLVSASYLVLSIRFWFSKPAIGSALVLACFIAAIAIADLPTLAR